MKSKVNQSMIAVIGLMALKAQAVGLGELVVHSKLGEPLTAEIEIIQSNGEFLAANEMIVNIATESEHAKRSLDGYLARKNLLLKLTETLNDDVSLKLSSNQPINEPFLNFLVELKWDAGRIIKEFTILLDPPGFQAEASPDKISPIVTTAVVTKTPVTIEQTVRPQAPKKTISDTPFINGQYGPVQQGETLSEIAMRVRPAGYGIALVDMIQAIHINNQHAFINNDKNLLQRDVMLRIPEATEVLANSDPDKSSQTVATITNRTASSQNTIQSTSISLFSSSESIDVTTSYTFSGLKLSTELDQSFLAIAKAMKLESTETLSAPETTQPIAETDVELSETESSDTLTETAIGETTVFDSDVSSEDLNTTIAVENTETFNDTQTEDSFESSITPVDTTNNSQSNTESISASSSNPIYLVISIIGALLSLSMIALLIYFRRDKAQDFQPSRKPIFNETKIPARVFVNDEEKAQSIKEIKAKSIDTETVNRMDEDLMDMEQTISEKTGHIATVVMSPEEFAEVGIDAPQKEDETFDFDKEQSINTVDDESLIKDFLDTVEIPDSIDEEPVIEEHSDFSINEKTNIDDNDSDNDETFIDISIPLNHVDNEVNTIINEVLEGELEAEASENDSLIIDSENDFIEMPEPTVLEDDLELKTITEHIDATKTDSVLVDLDNDSEPGKESETLLELGNEEHEEPETFDAPNIEDLVINFQASHPEKEFEKQISVFMAYGDYIGAEEVIEKALQESPDNNTYRIAQLSLFKATGKFGAALVLAEELNQIKHQLSEIEQKKLELLSDDLNRADDNSVNVAS